MAENEFVLLDMTDVRLCMTERMLLPHDRHAMKHVKYFGTDLVEQLCQDLTYVSV